jgi:hypothetical protein
MHLQMQQMQSKRQRLLSMVLLLVVVLLLCLVVLLLCLVVLLLHHVRLVQRAWQEQAVELCRVVGGSSRRSRHVARTWELVRMCR